MIRFDMDEVDLFLAISRKVIDQGRSSLKRLTKIEANLKELRLKYVVEKGPTTEAKEEGEAEESWGIAVEDLFFTKEHDHENFVFKGSALDIVRSTTTQFKSTGVIAKQN